MKTIDLRGRACPAPVVETRRIMDGRDTDEITVILDNDASCDNVTRMARNEGWEVQVDDRGMGEFIVTLRRGEGRGERAGDSGGSPAAACRDGAIITVLVGSDGLGGGNEELGRMLMRAFVKTLREAAPRPTHVLFLNRGVFLTTEGSVLLDDLKELEKQGVAVLSCGTCLDYFKLKGSLRVGKVTNMLEIVSLLLQSDRRITV